MSVLHAGVVLSPSCPFCGGERFVDLVEIWPAERAYLTTSCCEESHADLAEQVAYAAGELSATARTKFLRPLRELFESYGWPIRQVYDDGDGRLRTDFGLEVVEVELAEAKAFVAEYHSHNRPPVGWKWGHGIRNGDELVAVAMVGRPVARMLNPPHREGWVEVNRVCVRDDVDPDLVWNACSKLYGEAAREAKRRGLRRIITYTLETEDATSLKAVGWDPEHKTRGGSWNRPSRSREKTAPTCPKIRWAKELR